MTGKDRRLEAFGANIRRERQRAGISQEDLAAEAQISRAAASALERGVREPKLGTILAVAAALRVRPGVLLDDLV